MRDQVNDSIAGWTATTQGTPGAISDEVPVHDCQGIKTEEEVETP